jgi:tetratricopeptide (TPR) repeat protein
MDAFFRFEELGDLHGQADIVHLTGLFLLRQQELDKSQACFERSLALEIQSHTARPIVLADHGRHMGFVYQSSGELKRAIQKFERSFVIRRDNGLTDQAMFAAASLGLALVSENLAKGAEAPLDFCARHCGGAELTRRSCPCRFGASSMNIWAIGR